jgi:signal transduction histidine kinase
MASFFRHSDQKGSTPVVKKKFYIFSIVFLTGMVTFLHYLIFKEQSPHIVLEELYYIPLLVGAFIFGVKGALLTYLFVSAFYLPYFFGDWATTFLSWFDRLLHLLFSGIFAFLAGFLVDRHKRLQEQFEKDRYLAGLGQVAAAIVHDLRNPLISILGFAKRVREGKGNVSVATQVIEESALSMQRIVDGVLDFARPIRLDIREEDIQGVIQRACDSCRIKAEERKIALCIELPGAPVHVEIDGFSFQRALVNLVNNAIEASSEGRNVIVRTETEKNHVVIKVKDFGSGMDKETLENIFIPFYSKKASGTGLGMAIAKKVVEGHGGNIRINSQPGIGTEVMIELPYRPFKDLRV